VLKGSKVHERSWSAAAHRLGSTVKTLEESGTLKSSAGMLRYVRHLPVEEDHTAEEMANSIVGSPTNKVVPTGGMALKEQPIP
jgi:hypothetical protein